MFAPLQARWCESAPCPFGCTQSYASCCSLGQGGGVLCCSLGQGGGVLCCSLGHGGGVLCCCREASSVNRVRLVSRRMPESVAQSAAFLTEDQKVWGIDPKSGQSTPKGGIFSAPKIVLVVQSINVRSIFPNFTGWLSPSAETPVVGADNKP
jgi:hypothetical protein